MLMTDKLKLYDKVKSLTGKIYDNRKDTMNAREEILLQLIPVRSHSLSLSQHYLYQIRFRPVHPSTKPTPKLVQHQEGRRLLDGGSKR